MADKDQVSNKWFTITPAEFTAFQQFCDTEPMCKDWTFAPDFGWVTIHVPNWTHEVHEFYARIAEFVVFPPAKECTPTWFEGINPVIAERFGISKS